MWSCALCSRSAHSSPMFCGRSWLCSEDKNYINPVCRSIRMSIMMAPKVSIYAVPGEAPSETQEIGKQTTRVFEWSTLKVEIRSADPGVTVSVIDCIFKGCKGWQKRSTALVSQCQQTCVYINSDWHHATNGTAHALQKPTQIINVHMYMCN